MAEAGWWLWAWQVTSGNEGQPKGVVGGASTVQCVLFYRRGVLECQLGVRVDDAAVPFWCRLRDVVPCVFTTSRSWPKGASP